MTTTKKEIAQIVYKTAVDNQSPKEISKELEIGIDTVRRCVRFNKYAIQKRAMQFVNETLDDSMEVVKNSIGRALELSKKHPSQLTKDEILFQKGIGLACVEKSLEIGGVVGAPKSQSGVTQNIYQQNNTRLGGNVKEFLKGMNAELEVTEEEIIDATYQSEEETQEVNLESTE